MKDYSMVPQNNQTWWALSKIVAAIVLTATAVTYIFSREAVLASELSSIKTRVAVNEERFAQILKTLDEIKEQLKGGRP